MEANDGVTGASGSTAPRCVLTEEVLKDIYKGCVKLTPARMESVKAINQQMRDADWSNCFLIIDEEAGLVLPVVSRDSKNDSLDGAQASANSEVGSACALTEKDNTPNGAPGASKISTATTGSPLVLKRSRTPDGSPSSGARVPRDPLKMKSLPPAHRASWEATPEFFTDDLGFQSSDNPQMKLDFDIWAPQLEDCNEEEKQLGRRPMYLLNYEKKTIVRLIAPLPSDLNQDSLDGAQAFINEVGSAEEITEKDNTNDSPAEENVPDHNEREAEDAKENDDSAQDANGAKEEDYYVNGKNCEADSPEVEGVVAEMRMIDEVETPNSPSAKKVRSEEENDAPTNGDSVEAAVV